MGCGRTAGSRLHDESRWIGTAPPEGIAGSNVVGRLPILVRLNRRYRCLDFFDVVFIPLVECPLLDSLGADEPRL
jgi:hypothetical protein